MNEIGIMPTANWGGKERFEPASLRAEVTRLEAENERMRGAIESLEENVLNKIEDWANAYPDDVFIEPTPDQWRAADKLLKEHGMSMTAITGSAARHCVAGIKSYAKRGMKIISELESEAPNDSTKPKKTMTQREWDLRHANPYDLSGPHQPQMKRGLND